jgi:hypothetical protein
LVLLISEFLLLLKIKSSHKRLCVTWLEIYRVCYKTKIPDTANAVPGTINLIRGSTLNSFLLLMYTYEPVIIGSSCKKERLSTDYNVINVPFSNGQLQDGVQSVAI